MYRESPFYTEDRAAADRDAAIKQIETAADAAEKA